MIQLGQRAHSNLFTSLNYFLHQWKVLLSKSLFKTCKKINKLAHMACRRNFLEESKSTHKSRVKNIEMFLFFKTGSSLLAQFQKN